MNNEVECIPYQAVSTLGTGPALILAPHPDDEILGCAGAIIRHLQANDAVTVVIVTDGGGWQAMQAVREEMIARRRQESQAAANLLGYDTPQFWNYRDRELIADEALIQQIVTTVINLKTKILYAPSPDETHPDHRQLAFAAYEVLHRVEDIQLAFYEVGAPLVPNRLLDITDILKLKQRAIACFASQLKIQAYQRHILALNRYRTYTLPREVTAAEGYLVLKNIDNLNSYKSRTLLKFELERVIQEQRELQTRYEQLLNSRSWKLTAPLRTIWQKFLLFLK